MSEITVRQLKEIMDKPQNIRNWTMIGSVDHGRITLSDVLDERAGMRLADNMTPLSIAPVDKEASKSKFADKEEEKEDRIPSAAITLYHRESLPEPDLPEVEQDVRGRGSHVRPVEEADAPKSPGTPDLPLEEYILNLINSQGHADFSPDVASALRISDGAVVVIDCTQGMALETETGLRRALAERIKPVMAINKLDQGFLDLQLDWEMFYTNFSRHIDVVNTMIDTYRDPVMGDYQVYAPSGSVAFTAGSHEWGFTLPQFARLYSKKFKIAEEKMCERLWGDSFFIPSEKQWKRAADPKYRAFNLFILDPIGKIFSACMNNQGEKLNKMLQALSFKMKKQDLEQKGKELLKRTMRSWLPIDRALLDMIVKHLPSPVTAQKYRTDLLYSGPVDDSDDGYCGIRDCNPQVHLDARRLHSTKPYIYYSREVENCKLIFHMYFCRPRLFCTSQRWSRLQKGDVTWPLAVFFRASRVQIAPFVLWVRIMYQAKSRIYLRTKKFRLWCFSLANAKILCML